MFLNPKSDYETPNPQQQSRSGSCSQGTLQSQVEWSRHASLCMLHCFKHATCLQCNSSVNVANFWCTCNVTMASILLSMTKLPGVNLNAEHVSMLIRVFLKCYIHADTSDLLMLFHIT